MSADINSREIIGNFYDRLNQNTGLGWVPQIAMVTGSDQASEQYGWLSQVPAMREFDGGRHAKKLSTQLYTILNKEYEATMEFTLKELKRDKSGQVNVRINELARRANAHWGKLISDAIVAGEATECYDGQYFFDTDHEEGDSGAQSNDITVDISTLPVETAGTITAPSVEEMQQSILTGITQITGFVDDQGEPKNEDAQEFLVMVPQSLYMVANNAFTMPRGTGLTEQREADGFKIQIVANARLSSWTDQFAIFRTDADTKPFIAQEEIPIEIAAVAEGSELEFNERKHRYGVYASRNVGYGMWDKACLVVMV